MSQIEVPCRIPNIIHQTWKNSTVPPHWQASQDGWKKYHPDWEYKLWTDEDNRAFVSEKFPWFLKTFDDFPYGIQRADAIRYCILYEYGGLYCDLDIEPLGNLENLFPNEGVYLVQTKNNLTGIDYYTNFFMASTPKNPFWMEVIIETMKPVKWYNIGKQLKVFSTTGPKMLNMVAKRTTQTINLLPSRALVPCGICDEQPCKSVHSRIRFIPGSSWVEWDGLVGIFLMCNIRKIVTCILLLIMSLYIYKRYYSHGRLYFNPSD